ncbi:MAG TPA: hypothetical protein VFE53_05260 [Mucilaginibacter sp.]|jgi:hypothetical protein|nr:hypothetical protein [Mucilaginibacter sp.]
MRSFFSALFVFAFFSISYAQNQVYDPRPQAKIYIIDSQSGQEVETTSDLAILFKNALLDVIDNSGRSQAILQGAVPQQGGRVFTVTQMGTETNINGFQVSLDYAANNSNQPSNVYTCDFDIDNNSLYFYDQASQQWLLERITDNNLFNLRRTANFARQFKAELANQGAPASNNQSEVEASADLSTPVDADVVAYTAPPAMPNYEQPACPNDGYLWQPGYWAYSPYRNDYYWVPGAWVAPPSAGVYWTPPYWGYEGSRFIFHIGYWGDHVGFYGGINYGYGYGGHGYYGGEWRGGHFNYNTAVVRVNTTVVHNTYVNTTVINNTVINNNHVSYNGSGGVTAKPTAAEISAAHEQHIKPTAEQNSHQLQARANPNQFNKNNQGGKPILASATAMTYHPQNSGNKGGTGLSQGNAKQVQGQQSNNQVKPQGQQSNNQVKPQGQQSNNQVKPQGQQSNNPVKPQGPPHTQVKPVRMKPKAQQKPQPAGLPGKQ